MFCPNCGKAGVEGMKFCPQCGQKLMENIEIPKWVEGQLLEGEKVISRLSHGMADYYATDKRLLRFTGKSNCRALEYGKMSITFVRYGLGWSIFRTFAVIFGLLCIGLGILGFVGPTFYSGTTIYHTQAPFEYVLLFWGIGLFCILVPLNSRYGYYQIKGVGIFTQDLKKWQIVRNRWGAGNIDRFVKIVKEGSGRVNERIK